MQGVNLTLDIISLINLVIISVVYFLKNKIKTFENTFFSLLIINLFFNVVIELTSYIILSSGFGYESSIYLLLMRITLLLYLSWSIMFTIYIIYISLKNNNVHIKKLLIFSSIVIFTLIGSIVLFGNMEISKIDDLYIPSGISTIIVYIFAFLSDLISLIFAVNNLRKNGFDKKFLPVYTLILFGTLVIFFQFNNPEYFLITPLLVYTTFVMYFTIENPDVKMLEEFRIAKDRAEKANEEKELFLYNITQDIRNPLKEITKASNWLNENTRNKNVSDATYYINKNASSITDLVNNVLDISTLEITNIKVYKTSYNINNIIKFIEKTYKDKTSEKVDFRINVDSNIPTTLYGDQIRLKQAIQILLDNSIKYTKSGFIDLSINYIEKNKLCRLLITIEDSGEGIKPSEMEQILNKDNHLIKNEKIDDNISTIAMAKSIINLLGGTLLIDSELGTGTKMTIVLDQKIYDEKSFELNKIEKDVDKFIDNTKVMVVVENEEYREKVVKKLSKYELDLEVVELGSKCLDNIRMSKKYDLIIMDESLSHLSSIEIITKLKAIPSFNTPVTLLTDNTDNKDYINNGFTYLLDKKIPSKELEDIIDKIERSSK